MNGAEMNNGIKSMSDNRFYIDIFMYELVKAIQEINMCQRCAVDRVKKLMKDMRPEDPEIITPLSRAIDVGMDSPRRFSEFCKSALDRVEKNLASAKARNHE